MLIQDSCGDPASASNIKHNGIRLQIYGFGKLQSKGSKKPMLLFKGIVHHAALVEILFNTELHFFIKTGLDHSNSSQLASGNLPVGAHIYQQKADNINSKYCGSIAIITLMFRFELCCLGMELFLRIT
jgi:hypothetical protein